MHFKFSVMPLLLLLAVPAFSQSIKSHSSFSSINQFGLLSGEAESSFMVQTVNGVKKDRWFAGAGIGLDEYVSKTVPLFLDVRRDFSHSVNTPFAYANAGINFLIFDDADKIGGVEMKTAPGVYYDLGLGWKLSIKNNRSIIISAGYTLKQVKKQSKVNWGAPTPQLQSESYDDYKYLYRRLVLKLGFQL